MSLDKLQEAINQIKSGNRQVGQKLLAEVLSVDPNNETAWLWMSVLVSGEKQKYCLEKALSINPNNVQARQQLERLTMMPNSVPITGKQAVASPPPPAPVTVAPSKPVVTEPPAPESYAPMAAVASPQEVVTHSPQYWLIPNKHMPGIVCMKDEHLLSFDVLPNKVNEVVVKIKEAASLKQIYDVRSQWNLANVGYLSFPRVTSATLFGEAINIFHADASGSEKKTSISGTKETVEPIFNALHQRLGPQFQKITRPISRGKVVASGSVLFLLVSCVTGFFFWIAQGLSTETDPITGSARVRGLAALLKLLGPEGVLCIGGGLLLIVVVAFISSIAKPPQETVLMRKPKTA